MTDRIIGPSGSTKRRRRLFWLAALVAIAAGAFFVTASSGTLSGSTFQSADGNLDGTATLHDWNPASGGNLGPVETITCPSLGAGTNCGVDRVRPDALDDSLGQGSKEDDEVPTVVTGSIPPSKDDLSRFYVNKEKAAGNDYLYLAWERTNLLGSAHLDFELNQNATLSANGVTPVRTDGDLLIDFDFGGSGTPVLALHRWITTGTASTDCEVSNSLPCWNKAIVLNPAFVEAAVNNAPVTDNNPPGAPRTLDGSTKNGINSTFGEAGINLTGAGVFPSTKCENFGSVYVKSRSSGNSFGSELKDFIAPIPISISNCGKIVIKKRTNPRGVNQDFGFTSDIPNPVGTVTPASQPFCVQDNTPSAFTLNDNGNSGTSDSTGNTETCVNVLAGTYHVTENDPTSLGFDLTGLSCTTGGSGNLTTRQATITIATGDTVTCTFTNRQRGTIIVKKVTVPDPDPTTTSFPFTPAGSIGTTGFSLLNGGMKTYSNVVPGSANSVNETVPSNWVLTSATCDNGNDPTVNVTVAAGGTTTCTFTNTLQFGAIKVTKKSIKTGNAVLAGAKISIKDPQGNPLSGSPFTTDINGVVCVDSLLLGNYKVQETAAPPGYTIDDSTEKTVTVTGSNAKCTDTTFTGQTLTFFDTPKTDLLVKVTSQDSGPGGSTSTITCTTGLPAAFPGTSIGNSPQTGGPSAPVQVTANDLAPGDYTCKVHIDP